MKKIISLEIDAIDAEIINAAMSGYHFSVARLLSDGTLEGRPEVIIEVFSRVTALMEKAHNCIDELKSFSR